MGIRYINAEPNAKFTRPTGFVFPVGLTQTNAEGPTSVNYLVVAGGGAGGAGGGGIGGGGGGAGGFRAASGFSISRGTPYVVTVGGGGSASAYGVA